MSDQSITIPNLGDNVTSGVIGRWLKDVGDRVRKGEPVVEIQSDKVNLEVEAQADGVLEAILVPEGESVAIGAEIGRLGAGAGIPASNPSAVAPAVATPAPAPIVATEPARPSAPPVPAPTRAMAAPTPPAIAQAAHPDAVLAGPRLVSPAARLLAAEYGLDPEQIAGSGFVGAIQVADVRAWLEREPRERITTPPPRTEPVAAPARAEPKPIAPSGPGLRPLSPIRRAIAAAMTRSRAEIPDAWTSVEIDMSAVSKRREALKGGFAQRTGANLTFVAFFAEAVVAAVAEVPQVNSTWTEAGVQVHGAINLGIAVAGPRGLVAPVVRDAQRLSLEGLAVAIHQAIDKARLDKLTPEDLREGTFTLNNTGALGSVFTQAIPVPGQAGIITMEAMVKRVVVLPDDSLAVRPMMNSTLSFDHRIIDGAEALKYLGAVKRHLESQQA